MSDDITIRLATTADGKSALQLWDCSEQAEIIQEFARIHEIVSLAIAPSPADDKDMLFVVHKANAEIAPADLEDFNGDMEEALGISSHSISSGNAMHVLPQMELEPYQPDRVEPNIQILDVNDQEGQQKMDAARDQLHAIRRACVEHGVSALLITPDLDNDDPEETQYDAIFAIRMANGNTGIAAFSRFTDAVKEACDINALPLILDRDKPYLGRLDLKKPFVEGSFGPAAEGAQGNG